MSTTHNIHFGNLEGGSADPMLVVTSEELAFLLKHELVQVLPVRRRYGLMDELQGFEREQQKDRGW